MQDDTRREISTQQFSGISGNNMVAGSRKERLGRDEAFVISWNFTLLTSNPISFHTLRKRKIWLLEPVKKKNIITTLCLLRRFLICCFSVFVNVGVSNILV